MHTDCRRQSTKHTEKGKITMSSDDDKAHPKQPHLKPQDATKVDPTKLSALTPEVVSRPYSFCFHSPP